MEKETKRRGRPATGRIRDKQLKLQITQQERDKIYTAMEEHNQKNVVDLIITLIDKNK